MKIAEGNRTAPDRSHDRAITKIEAILATTDYKHPDPERITNPHVLTFMEDFISADKKLLHGEWLAGEIYWLFFQANPEIQNTFIEKVAAGNRIPTPDPTWTPRQRLIHAQYGNDLEYVDDSGGKHDSKAGKRITAAMRRFLIRAGLKKRKKRADELVPRKTKDFLAEMYEIASKEEMALLNRLIARKYGRKVLTLVAAVAA